uniref:Uncharacterized protein n=1 Tax=Meloidogyne floridensis TaxID=298350 RepID=A0A915NKS9_9BILA
MGCSNLFTGNNFICGKIGNEACQQKNSWIMSDYNKNQPYQTKCEFNFAMNNPKTGQNFVDLTDLLLNAPDYVKWFMMESCSKYSAFHSTRSCVEKKKNKFYCGHANNDNNCGKEGFDQMEICDHPNYGLVKASFEKDLEIQKIDVTRPDNKCDKP